MRRSSLDDENDNGRGQITRFPATASGAGSGGVDAAGVLDSRMLPDREFINQWDAVILDAAQKDRLLSQAILNFTLRDNSHSASREFNIFEFPCR